jgi:formate hydrogenlyase subunit 3/multisubunit Na+/H+ antiporter MnhD subunit
MEPIIYLIIVPFVFGLFCYILPKKVRAAGEISGLFGSIVPFVFAYKILVKTMSFRSSYILIDNLSRFTLFFTGLFGFLIILYSLAFFKNQDSRNKFYAYTLWTLSGAFGALISNNTILLLVFWGFIGLTLYLMIGLGGAGASDASKKTFIIVGGSDAFLLLGIAILWFLSKGSYRMDTISINLVKTSGFMPTLAFLCLVIAAFTKAGAMPFHTWIPDCAEKAPIPTTALLPASLDKLLGIYLLARTTMYLFTMNRPMQILLLLFGAFTIIAAVFMALTQHDFKKLLGYHAVSQVGYMVLGIATCNPIGIAGGLFHMVNNAIYKSCLFLCGGAVEKQTGSSDLDKLGGLARFMPYTFIAFVIASLAISGVPPLNGFTSKWMIYQGVVEMGRTGDKLWIVWLVAAMFGSALTLASFMKLIHAIFLGQRSKELENKEIKKTPCLMLIPIASLAVLCVIFGVFAESTGLGLFVLPAVPGVKFIGLWDAFAATGFLLAGLVIGLLIYWRNKVFKMFSFTVKETDSYVGGEILEKGIEVTGVDFYKTVQDMGFFKGIYKKAEKKWFDIYEQGKNLVFAVSSLFQKLHTGVLPTYAIWSLIGLAILILILAFSKGGM